MKPFDTDELELFTYILIWTIPTPITDFTAFHFDKKVTHSVTDLVSE